MIKAELTEEDLPKYTDIVYKASGGKSAFENMVDEFAVNPLAYSVGSILKTGGTTWRYEDSTGPVTGENFRAFSCLNALDCHSFEGSDDYTDTLDYANAKAIELGLNLFLPKGIYKYNGTGLKTSNSISIFGESTVMTSDVGTVIDCSDNTNSGHIIEMVGFRTGVSDLGLRGNPSNPLLRGLKAKLNQGNSLVDNVSFQNLHYGMDLDNLYYCGFSRLIFRTDGDVKLNGSHITIGGYEPTKEVNNILFDRVYFTAEQKVAVTVACYTQSITYQAGSFENKGLKILFTTDSTPNTTIIKNCYIESEKGDSTDTLIIKSEKNKSIKVKLNECLVRSLDSETGFLFSNVRVVLEDVHGNAPTYDLCDSTSSVTYFGENTLANKSNFYPAKGGLWNSSTQELNATQFKAEAPPMNTQEVVSVIPKYVHLRNIAKDADKLAVFAVYLPSDGSNQRKIRLDFKVTAQATESRNNICIEHWSLAFMKGQGIGDNPSSGQQAVMVAQGGQFVRANSVTTTLVGYDSATDSQKYIIYYHPDNSTYALDCVMEVEGTFINQSTINTPSTWPWKIEKL